MGFTNSSAQCTFDSLSHTEPNPASLLILSGTWLFLIGMWVRSRRTQQPNGVSKNINLLLPLAFTFALSSMYLPKLQPCLGVDEKTFEWAYITVLGCGAVAYVAMFVAVVRGLRVKCRGCGKRGVPETKYCCWCGVKSPLAKEGEVEEESLLDVKEG